MQTTKSPSGRPAKRLHLSEPQRKLILGMMRQPQRTAWRHYEHPATFDSLIKKGLAKVVSRESEKVVRAQLTAAGAQAWSQLTGAALADAAPKPKAAPASAVKASEADVVFAALDSGHWGFERNLPQACLTAGGNRRIAWVVVRRMAPYCADRPGSMRSWSGPTALAALSAACKDLGLPVPSPKPAAR
jgi:hypothetical protein